MNRSEFGKLVASLRKEHEDEEHPDLKPWSQRKLAREANQAIGYGDNGPFTEDVISNIERGRRGLDQRILLALANALQLTSGERKEFFLAASGIDNDKIVRPEDYDPEQVLVRLIERVREVHLPAFIIDSFCDVVAVNSAVLELLDLDSAGMSIKQAMKEPFGLNMLQFVFSNKAEKFYHDLMGRYWDDYAYQNMMMFRTLSLQYRSSQYFQDLLQTLKKYKEFKRFWRDVYFQEKDHVTDNEFIRLNSPRWGRLVYFSTSFITLTRYSDLYFCVYNPVTSDTSAVFAQIVELGGADIFRIGNWPQTYSADQT